MIFSWEQLLRSQISAAKDKLPSNFETDIASMMPRLRSGQQPTPGDDATSNQTPNEIAEKVHITTHPRLVKANEIVIQQPTILEHAKPILSPGERLTRSDKQIINALVEKHSLITDQLLAEKVSVGPNCSFSRSQYFVRFAENLARRADEYRRAVERHVDDRGTQKSG